MSREEEVAVVVGVFIGSSLVFGPAITWLLTYW
jgi:hypothetical protein